MKKVLVVALVVMATLCSLAFAQPLKYRVTIPFAFHAGDALLQAGEYEISPLYLSTLMVQRADGGDGIFVPMNRFEISKAIPRDSISFNRYGEEYFLAALDAGELKATMYKTKLEKKLAGEDVKGTVIAYLIK
jgi:hypothetical protein